MKGPGVEVVTFGGEQRYQRLLAGAPGTRGMRSGYVVLQPQESVGEHSTEGKEEAIIILEGSVHVVVNGKPACAAERGQLVYIPPHTIHDMINAGPVPARYVYVVAPVPGGRTC